MIRQNHQKFHTFVTFENSNEVKPYVLVVFMNKNHRSYLAHYRYEVLPLD